MAGELLDTAYILAKQARNVKELAHVYASQGDIYFVKKNYTKALDCYEHASELFLKTKSHRELVNTYVLSSRIMSAEGNTKRALQLLTHDLVYLSIGERFCIILKDEA